MPSYTSQCKSPAQYQDCSQTESSVVLVHPCTDLGEVRQVQQLNRQDSKNLFKITRVVILHRRSGMRSQKVKYCQPFGLPGHPGTKGKGLQTFKKNVRFFASFEVSIATHGLPSLLKSLKSYSLPAASGRDVTHTVSWKTC